MKIGKGITPLFVDFQCLGRLFRVGQNPVVVMVPPFSTEDDVVARVKQKTEIMLIGPTSESTGLSLHKKEGIDNLINSDTLKL